MTPLNKANAPEPVPLRPAEAVMRLARFRHSHPSRLSFLRIMLRQMASQPLRFERRLFDIHDNGTGTALYCLHLQDRTFSLVAFAHELADERRTDRVIAEAWDATFALVDGIPTDEQLIHLEHNVPLQEAGRVTEKCLCLSRANKSVRLWNTVVDALAQGQQPDEQVLKQTGYLMRTTAVYGSGKFGLADFRNQHAGDFFRGNFFMEMLCVWLIRNFSVDLVEKIAELKGGTQAIKLKPELKRNLGIGNSTGLGMAPFLVRHPELLHKWIHTRERALACVLACSSTDANKKALLKQQLAQHRLKASNTPQGDCEYDEASMQEWSELEAWMDHPHGMRWLDLFQSVTAQMSMNTQELLASMLLEIYPEHVDPIAESLFAADLDPYQPIDAQQSCKDLMNSIEQRFGFALKVDWSRPESHHFFWYASEEKLEPRIGIREQDPGQEQEMDLAIARDVAAMYQDLGAQSETTSVAAFLLHHPDHRHVVRRAQRAARLPYAEILDNLIGENVVPIDLLRLKLAFFGAHNFNPRSDLWLRISLFRDQPYPHELHNAS